MSHDQVFCLRIQDQQVWYAMVNGQMHGAWPNRGTAEAGMQVEQRRAKANGKNKLASHSDDEVRAILDQASALLESIRWASEKESDLQYNAYMMGFEQAREGISEMACAMTSEGDEDDDC